MSSFPAIRTDPVTGYKLFNTRASKASSKIQGKGYSPVKEEALKTLPEAPVGAVFDAAEQAKYRKFKEERAGAADYITMEGSFSKYLTDHYSAEPVPRESLNDECEILVVGAGFAGLLLWHKLREEGFHNVRFCENRWRCWRSHGTGIVILELHVMLNPIHICLCLKKWDIFLL